MTGTGRPGPGDRCRDDAGQVMLLVLGYSVVLLLLVTVVVGATSVHLTRHRLLGVADGAALDAADALDAERFYTGSGAGPLPLSDAGVQASVAEYLAVAAPLQPFPAPVVGHGTGSPDGVTAEVTLTTTARLPLVSSVLGPWSDGVAVTVTARARVRAAG